ncbi:hypothetical protein [Streptomyces hirsutus]|uniref:hypothetical protein n=1 Tax=Streptomyces hirsutus TaxID=35620 RepID=UPI0036C24726
MSRATFFNYFAGKEAVVFDQDPEARERWLALLEARTPGEPIWNALTAVMIEVNEGLRDRMPLMRRLKRQTPALAGPARHPAISCGPTCRTGSWPRATATTP